VDSEAVADDKHPDQQLGIDRRPADVAVERIQLFVQIAEHRCHENVDPAQQVTAIANEGPASEIHIINPSISKFFFCIDGVGHE
jgi:hypothetical protein